MNDPTGEAPPLLIPGVTCAGPFAAPRAGLLIDGRDYYRAVYQAASRARRSILITGWQLGTRARLLVPPDDEGARYPAPLLDFLGALCTERPELEVHVLAWDAASLFALEREWMQELRFRWRGHDRIRYRLDACHPIGGSHHQKYVVVDRAIAFVGGMDVCEARWDDRAHRHGDPRRGRSGGTGYYPPYHDVQAFVTGEAVDVLRGWFAERWRRCAGEPFELPEVEREEIPIDATCEVDAPRLGLCRTQPDLPERCLGRVEELRALHVRAIRSAERVIYIENQYFSSEDVRWALLDRMLRTDRPRLEIAIVLPRRTAGPKEQIAIGVRQAEILRELRARAAATGHRLGVFYAAAPGPDGGDEEAVFIHAKVLAVDDRFLLVSSANATNRSMGLDSELGLAWEAPAATDSLRAARVELMREHVGLGAAEAGALLGDPRGLVDRLERLAADGRHRLRRHALDESRQPGHFLARLLADEVPLDPDRPVYEVLLPWRLEPVTAGGMLGRVVSGLRQMRTIARQLRRRRRHRHRRGSRGRAAG